MKEPGEVYRIGISGSYGGLNLGDEAILQSIVVQLRNSLPVEITVFSRNPEDTLRRHEVDRAVPVREMTRNEISPEIRRLDLFILGGGGILFDREVGIYLREVLLAHEMGVPVMIYAIGAGPLEKGSSQELVSEALNDAVVVTVREKGAKKLLEDVGVDREIIVTADPALLLQPEPLPENTLVRENLDGERRLVGMSVREPGAAAPDIDEKIYHSLLASAADYMVDRYDADVVLIPMERRMLDLQHSHAVVSQMLRPQRATILKGQYTSGQILTMMKRLDFAVGMRLHFLIFSALQGIPFVALPYASKVRGFLEDLEIQMPPISLVNAGRLIAHIDQFWDTKSSELERIARLLPGLQERASQTNRILVDLLEKGSPKSRKKPKTAQRRTMQGGGRAYAGT
jgi:polysaccharide pyruvyl transferase CsaB